MNFNNWFDVGLELDIPADKLDEIEKDSQDTNVAKRKMFQYWLKNFKCSYEILAYALETRGETSLANDIRIKHCVWLLYIVKMILL